MSAALCLSSLLLTAALAHGEPLLPAKNTRFESAGGHVDLALDGDDLAFHLSTPACDLRGKAAKSTVLTYRWETSTPKGQCSLTFGLGAGEVRLQASPACAQALCKGRKDPPSDFRLPDPNCRPKPVRTRRRAGAKAFGAARYADAAAIYDTLSRECKAFLTSFDNVSVLLELARSQVGMRDAASCSVTLSRIRAWEPARGEKPWGFPAWKRTLAKTERGCRKISR